MPTLAASGNQGGIRDELSSRQRGGIQRKFCSASIIGPDPIRGRGIAGPTDQPAVVVERPSSHCIPGRHQRLAGNATAGDRKPRPHQRGTGASGPAVRGDRAGERATVPALRAASLLACAAWVTHGVSGLRLLQQCGVTTGHAGWRVPFPRESLSGTARRSSPCLPGTNTTHRRGQNR